MTDDLVMAEECIDRRAKTEVFDGRNIRTDTGRVLLHALAGDGTLLCGSDPGSMATTERQWGAAYLPHVPRCRGCVSARPGAIPASAIPDGSGLDAGWPAAPAAGVEIRTAHDAEDELAAATRCAPCWRRTTCAAGCSPTWSPSTTASAAVSVIR